MFSPDFIAAATGPVKAFLDSDFCGQLIVLIQIGMSIYSWSVMLRRNLFMKDIQRRSDRFADDFVKAPEGPIGLYCDRNYTFTDSPMESVYTKTCDRLIHLIPQNQLKALHLDSSMPLTLSAKRMALVTATASHALEEGFGVIIAAAGKAAHLAGVLAAYTTLPVIGVPIKTSLMGGLDSLLSMVQMPKGIPVACVAVDGADNAAILAAQMLALSDPELTDRLVRFKADMAVEVAKKDEKIRMEEF